MAAEIDHHILDLPRFEVPARLLIVVSPYYKSIADALVTGARNTVESCGATVDLIEVPGALEIPPAIALAARAGRHDGFVALGCVIRGETTHYETVCTDSSRGLMLLGLQGLAIGNGILTVENEKQAQLRADPNGQDKGGGAAAAALHLIALARKFPMRERALPTDDDMIRLAGQPKDGRHI